MRPQAPRRGLTTFIVVLAAFVASLSRTDREQVEIDVAPSGVTAGVLWVILGPQLVALVHLASLYLRQGQWRAAALLLPWILGYTIVLFPWVFARRWFIPRGRPLLAWLVSRLSFWMWRRDVAGGAVVAAAWAALRSGPPARSGEATDSDGDGSGDDPVGAFVQGRLDKLATGAPRWTVGSASIVAAGLLAARRGDLERARRLLRSAGDIDETCGPRKAVVIAWEWLCADAIDRGAWRELDELARNGPVSSRSLQLFGAIAARLVGHAPMPTDRELWVRWLLAPHRAQTLALVERAIAAPPTPRKRRAAAPKGSERSDTDQRSDTDEDTAEQPPLCAALEAHAALLSTPPSLVGVGELATLARQWDAVFDDPSLDEQLLDRCIALVPKHPPDPVEMRAAFREQLRDDLLGLAKAADLPIHEVGARSELLGQAARELRARLLDALEIAATALASRVEARRDHEPLDEWQTFVNLRAEYVEAVSLGGVELRRLAFQDVHGPVCSLAVWLWNVRGEKAIANAMFQWLLDEAIVVDDAEAIRLQEKNVNCGV